LFSITLTFKLKLQNRLKHPDFQAFIKLNTQIIKLEKEILPQMRACAPLNWPIPGNERMAKINMEKTQLKKEIIARYDQRLFMRNLSPENLS
jgi:hypothetical protein